MADGSQGCGRLQRSKRLPNGFLDHFFHEELVAEARFELGGMDVDVDRITRQVEEQEQRGAVPRRDRGSVSRLRSAQDKRIPNGTTAYEHVAFAAGRSRLRRPLYQPRDFE